jgi:hypothetical protein
MDCATIYTETVIEGQEKLFGLWWDERSKADLQDSGLVTIRRKAGLKYMILSNLPHFWSHSALCIIVRLALL